MYSQGGWLQPNPRHHPAVRLTLRRLARVKGEHPGKRRQPLRQEDVDAMIAALGGSLRDARGRT